MPASCLSFRQRPLEKGSQKLSGWQGGPSADDGMGGALHALLSDYAKRGP